MDEGGSGSGIVVEGVARSFGAVHAVRDATFTARAGEVTALVGPNGSGKTTLLLVLATLLTPDAGIVRIEGRDPVTEPGAVRGVMGWMPDVLGSWPNLSVRTTLELTGRLYRMDRATAQRRADELLGLVGLAPLASAATRVLSRGQKQRLSLARALVHDPRVLLLDEPASGLDPAARVDLRHLVRRLADEGRTVLISSHVLAELEEMADAAVYLDAGVTASPERVAAAQTRARDWRIRALDRERLRSTLAERAGVSWDGEHAIVRLTSEADAAELLAQLAGAGARVVEFGPAVGTLEHTFLDLAGEAS